MVEAHSLCQGGEQGSRLGLQDRFAGQHLAGVFQGRPGIMVIQAHAMRSPLQEQSCWNKRHRCMPQCTVWTLQWAGAHHCSVA